MKKIIFTFLSFLILIYTTTYTFAMYSDSCNNLFTNFTNDYNKINQDMWIIPYLNTKKYEEVNILKPKIQLLIKKKMVSYYEKNWYWNTTFSCYIHKKVIKLINKLSQWKLDNKKRFYIFILNWVDYQVRLIEYENLINKFINM